MADPLPSNPTPASPKAAARALLGSARKVAMTAGTRSWANPVLATIRHSRTKIDRLMSFPSQNDAKGHADVDVVLSRFEPAHVPCLESEGHYVLDNMAIAYAYTRTK